VLDSFIWDIGEGGLLMGCPSKIFFSFFHSALLSPLCEASPICDPAMLLRMIEIREKAGSVSPLLLFTPSLWVISSRPSG